MADVMVHPEDEVLLEPPVEDGLLAGRPAEDRSFELVEVAVGAATGVAVGTAVGGPLGALVGGLVGGAAGVVGSEALEVLAGRAAETTDATEGPDDR